MTPTEIDRVARAIYTTHWRQTPSGNHPPTWENTTEEIRDWVRAQAVSAIEAIQSELVV